MNAQIAAAQVPAGNGDDVEYSEFLQRINARFRKNSETAKVLFTTDANLWDVYLNSFADPVERQHHTCSTCKQFIRRFGALATINASGDVSSPIWNEEDAAQSAPSYQAAVAAMQKAVRRAKITGVFLASESTWGTPVTGVWHHFHVQPPAEMIYKRATLTAKQAMAEKREDFKNVIRALAEFKHETVVTALKLLRSDALYRSEKVLGQAEWLADLHAARSLATNPKAKTNVVWKAVGSAPAGFCHPRSSMIGTLLEDIAAGKDFGEVSRAFAAKMNPLAYRRPTAAPTSGAIAQAEKIVQQLGAQGSLARRFARLDEVQALWRPAGSKPPETVSEGVFGHLKAKGSSAASTLRVPAQTMTWDKFQRTVLPAADRIEMLAPAIGSYTALVTAVNPDAPPILQWDRKDARNPVSWYFWQGGARAAAFNLEAGSYVEVEAVAHQPSMWNGGNEHQGAGVLFVLRGAKESKNGGAGLFPEILKSEFHGIRSVLEAYSRSAEIEGLKEPHAAGIMLTRGSGKWNAHVRVWSDGSSTDYMLDRWD
jgi:hypothetical protein